jgi:hypothetical protein
MKQILCATLVLVFVATFAAAETKDLNGSSISYDGYTYNGPADVDLFFTATQVTTTTEWFDRISITFPAPWVVVSVTAADFDVTGGVGTATATAADSGYPCSGFGKDCGLGCSMTVKINPNGVMDPGTPVTWMLEGDTWNLTPDSVICSVSDACSYDACYATLGVDQTGLDMTTGPVPVELISISIE